MRTDFARVATLAAALGLLLLGRPAAYGQDEGAMSERVAFMSADGRTMLVGYLFKPTIPLTTRVPAVVMMHGRAGAYSERANGKYDASTLSLRHKTWGREWVAARYIAILVDGFGPRGYPEGFPRFSYDSRPDELDETTVRPLDAYGALAYLRSRSDIVPDRIGLQGWSNGGSAAIAAMSAEAPGLESPTPLTGFRAAIAFYPACGLKGQFKDKPFRPYAPMLVMHGSADEEVSFRRCVHLIEESRANGGNVEIEIYRGATHSFDSPSRKRQSVDANSAATKDAVARSLDFFERFLRGR
ncbi:MAG: dienelactone hydrolase family protein [Hyphomicrobiaceae bacterium]